MSSPKTCPVCGKQTPAIDAAFCPFCGAPLAPAHSVDEAARKLVAQADKLADPVKRHNFLLEASRERPDSLEIEEALLHLGRLYERSPKKMDYSVIKCYLLQMYLTPGDFSDEKREAMRRELFHHPRLERCLELAPDRAAFTRRYLERLGREFIQVFLRGDNRYMQSIFGFRMDSRAPKLLAAPVARMLSCVRADAGLEADERAALHAALYAAFSAEMGGETSWLDAALDTHARGEA